MAFAAAHPMLRTCLALALLLVALAGCGSPSPPGAYKLGSPYQIQESVHANYWGQLAMRACMRLAYNGGVPRGGRCVRSANGLSSRGEPNMALL